MPPSTCFARIKTGEKEIPGTDKVCFTGGECGKPGFKKIVIDDGDAYFMICKDCFKNFLTKGSSSSTWNGWFDCDYPAGSQFYGSSWWWRWKREGERALACRADPEVQAVVAEIDEILSQSSKSSSSSVASEESVEPPPQPASKKEMLEAKIAELNAFLKAPGKKMQKEVVAATREVMKLRGELKLLK